MKPKIPHFRQETAYTCGPACMKMIFSALGIKKSERVLSKELKTNKIRGTYQHFFLNLAEKYKLKFLSKSKSSLKEVRKLIEKNHAVIVSYYLFDEKTDHYSIIKKIDSNFVYFIDPFYGEKHKYKISHFLKIWKSSPKYENNQKWLLAIKIE